MTRHALSPAETSNLEPRTSNPACPHFGPCGGCQLQHLAYPAQLAAKAARLRTLLAATGLQLPELQLHASPPLAYRNRIRLTLAEVSGQLRAGYLSSAPPETSNLEPRTLNLAFLPIAQCPITAPAPGSNAHPSPSISSSSSPPPTSRTSRSASSSAPPQRPSPPNSPPPLTLSAKHSAPTSPSLPEQASISSRRAPPAAAAPNSHAPAPPGARPASPTRFHPSNLEPRTLNLSPTGFPVPPSSRSTASSSPNSSASSLLIQSPPTAPVTQRGTSTPASASFPARSHRTSPASPPSRSPSPPSPRSPKPNFPTSTPSKPPPSTSSALRSSSATAPTASSSTRRAPAPAPQSAPCSRASPRPPSSTSPVHRKPCPRIFTPSPLQAITSPNSTSSTSSPKPPTSNPPPSSPDEPCLRTPAATSYIIFR